MFVEYLTQGVASLCMQCTNFSALVDLKRCICIHLIAVKQNSGPLEIFVYFLFRTNRLWQVNSHYLETSCS